MAQYQVRGVVHQRQVNPRACWYTSLGMVVRYHRDRRRQTTGDLVLPGEVPAMQQRFLAGANPSWVEWRAWAQQLGFKAVNLSPTPVGIFDLLVQDGPIIYSGTWGQTFDGHAVVVTGIDTAGPTVFVDDPLEAMAPVARAMNTYMAQLTQSLWETPLFVFTG